MLPALVAALARQRQSDGRPFGDGELEVLLLLNNCTDASGTVARRLARTSPPLRVHVVEVQLGAHEAHVGRARQLAMDLAATRLVAVGAVGGAVCSTDADTQPASDWIAATLDEIASGADAVAGRITITALDRAALPRAARRALLLDVGYRRALEALRELYAPTPHDPFPRHHQHFGASLAVRADAYLPAGGMPAVRSSEDVALYRALVARGARVRHSYRVRVATSGRRDGRAQGGLADALAAWTAAGREALVETASAAERRVARIALDRRDGPGHPDDPDLLTPPDSYGGPVAPIGRVLQDLRARVSALSEMTPAARLHHAAGLHRLALAA